MALKNRKTRPVRCGRKKDWLMVLVPMVVSLSGGGQATAASQPKCPQVSKPVVSLDLGSRYEKGDASRSEIDADSNAAVNKALKPIDGYVRSLANLVDKEPKKGAPDNRYVCLFRALDTWAKGKALSDLGTVNAKLAISPRLSGIAIAYREATEVAKPTESQKRSIESWLKSLGMQVMTFFDKDAPNMASQNNLRAWGGLAVGQIGVITQDETLTNWGAATNEMIICSAEDDGSLPFEMKRGDKALHYQLHAVGPLVVNAAVLNEKYTGSFDVCNGKLDRIVGFTLSALDDPKIVSAKAGVEQTFSTGKEKIEAFQLAWLEPYLRHRDNAAGLALAKKYRPLSNSTLGGNLTKQYANDAGARRVDQPN
jgi:poly(beta-D-mannuronate) lyase